MNVIITIVSMSLSGSAMLLLYLAARRGLKRYLPASGFYALMLLIMLRLLLPYSFDFSLMNRLPFVPPPGDESAVGFGETENDGRPVPEVSSAAEDEIPSVEANADGVTGTLLPEEVSGSAEEDVEEFSQARGGRMKATQWTALLLSVWGFGACVSFGMTTAAYFAYRARVMAAAEYSEPYTDMLCVMAANRRFPPVLTSSDADTPMVLGLLRPSIVLPERAYSLRDLRNILRHEYCHYRRNDIAVKWLAAMVCALHWFNPLMLLFRRELEDICELSCDELATRGMDYMARRGYIRTLLRTAAQQAELRAMLLTTMGGGARRLNRRFEAINEGRSMTPKRAAACVTAIVLALVVGMGLGARTFPQRGGVEDNAVLSSDEDKIPVNQGTERIYDGFYYSIMSQDTAKGNGDSVAEGVSHNALLTRSLFRLLDWERYEYLGTAASDSLMDGETLTVNFGDELCVILPKGGDMRVYLDSAYTEDLVLRGRYPEFLYPETDETGRVERPKICVFRVPDDLYGKVFSMLAPLAEREEELYGEEGFNGIVAENGRRYSFADIDNDFICNILTGKIRVISAAYRCDFVADVGSEAYDAVWNTFAGMAECEQLQPRPELEKSDLHIMIIGPCDYGEDYVGEYITVYADSSVICAHFKGDEMWFSLPKNLHACCEAIVRGERNI